MGGAGACAEGSLLEEAGFGGSFGAFDELIDGFGELGGIVDEDVRLRQGMGGIAVNEGGQQRDLEIEGGGLRQRDGQVALGRLNGVADDQEARSAVLAKALELMEGGCC